MVSNSIVMLRNRLIYYPMRRLGASPSGDDSG